MYNEFEIVFYAPTSIGGVNIYLKNLGLQLSEKKINFKIIYYGFELNNLFVNDFETILKLDKYDSEITHYKKLRSFISSDSTVVIANDSLELEMYNFFKLKNKLMFIMHGDNNHYKSLVNNEAIDKKLFVSLALSKKFNHDGDNVLNPIIENGNLNNAILSEPLKIAYVGRLEEDKGANEIENIDQLIRIDWGFFVPILNSKMEYIENISSKKLFFDMENIELIKNLKNFNFLFFPSKSEGFGIAIVESMKNGVIPIVRDINSGVIAELQDGVNCIKYSDLEILHKKLKNILVNPSIYYDLKKNTYEFSISKFDNNKILHDFLNHINKIKYSLKKNYSNVRLPVIHYMPNSIFRIVKKIQNAFN